jgi:hypothetical protein
MFLDANILHYLTWFSNFLIFTGAFYWEMEEVSYHDKRLYIIAFAVFTSVFLFPSVSLSQNVFLQGKIYDSTTRQPVGSVSVQDLSSSEGTLSNDQGAFRLRLKRGDHVIIFSHLGFENADTTIIIKENLDITVFLHPSDISLNEVTVRAEASENIVSSQRISSVTIKKQEMMKMPSLLGETDPLGLLRFTPGVQSGSEGNTGFNIRGGGNDQNLILYDNALVYNPGHLLGFFSVFNPDAVKDVNIMKSGIPSRYGGKLSSVISVRSFEGNRDSLELNANVGLISSRLTLSGPLSDHRGTFIIGGRRTYLNLLAEPIISKMVKNQTFFSKDNRYGFYDMNAGIGYSLGPDDHITISAYHGRDNYNMFRNRIKQNYNLQWGNSLGSIIWEHSGVSRKLISGVSWTKYNFDVTGSQDEYSFGLFSSVSDINFRSDLSVTMKSHVISTGVELIEHHFVPNNITANASNFVLNFNQFNPMNAFEGGIYADDEFQLFHNLHVSAGIRLSFFSQHGPYDKYIGNPPDITQDTIHYSRYQSLAFYSNPEPRIILRYEIDKNTSIKASYMRIAQYVHLATSGTVSLPTDLWIPSTSFIKPMTGSQVSAGYFRNYNRNEFEFSAEVYYKSMKNKLEFLRGIVYNSIFGKLEDNITAGQGRSYGFELFLRKKTGKLTGLVSYTLSATEQKFNIINEGYWYPAKYDRRHDLTFTATEKLNSKWNFSSSFILTSGNAYTIPIGRYIIQGNLVNEYGGVNKFRMPAYHRLDISLTRQVKMKNLYSELILSVYNVYNRANPYLMFFETKGSIEDYSLEIKPVVTSLFPVIPSLSWRFTL